MEKYFTRPFSNWAIIGYFGVGIILGQINFPSMIHSILWYLFLAYLACIFIYSVKVIPKYKKDELLYSESSASGYSNCHIFTKLGGGRNCVRLRLTKDLLIISSWFPFSLLAPIFDMVHVIPYSNILEIKPKNILWMKGVKITYKDKYQESVGFTLFPKNLEKFISVLNVKLAQKNQLSG